MTESVDWAFEDSKRHPVDEDYDVGKQLGEYDSHNASLTREGASFQLYTMPSTERLEKKWP
jgi:hypothetical protein